MEQLICRGLCSCSDSIPLPTALVEKLGSSSVAGQTFAQLLRRPQVTIDDLVPICRQLAPEFFVHDGLDARVPHICRS